MGTCTADALTGVCETDFLNSHENNLPKAVSHYVPSLSQLLSKIAAKHRQRALAKKLYMCWQCEAKYAMYSECESHMRNCCSIYDGIKIEVPI